MRKSCLIALAAFLLAGATTAFAEYEGNFEGTGDGYCYPYEGLIIYPFQTWEGELTCGEADGEWLFEGTWQDEEGNHGTLKNCKLKYIDYPYAPYLWSYQAGRWYWLETVNGVEIPRFGGFFSMNIYVSNEECPTEGVWGTTSWPPIAIRHHQGHRVP